MRFRVMSPTAVRSIAASTPPPQPATLARASALASSGVAGAGRPSDALPARSVLNVVNQYTWWFVLRMCQQAWIEET